MRTKEAGFSHDNITPEEQLKRSKNYIISEDGFKYSCHFEIGKKDGCVSFNTYNKREILNPCLIGLNLYERVSWARLKTPDPNAPKKPLGMTKQALEAFLDIIKCPV